MRDPADTFGPYELWEEGGRFGAEFRYVDESVDVPSEVIVRIPTAGFDLSPLEREQIYMEIAARWRPGTRFIRDGGAWKLIATSEPPEQDIPVRSKETCTPSFDERNKR